MEVKILRDTFVAGKLVKARNEKGKQITRNFDAKIANDLIAAGKAEIVKKK